MNPTFLFCYILMPIHAAPAGRVERTAMKGSSLADLNSYQPESEQKIRFINQGTLDLNSRTFRTHASGERDTGLENNQQGQDNHVQISDQNSSKEWNTRRVVATEQTREAIWNSVLHGVSKSVSCPVKIEYNGHVSEKSYQTSTQECCSAIQAGDIESMCLEDTEGVPCWATLEDSLLNPYDFDSYEYDVPLTHATFHLNFGGDDEEDAYYPTHERLKNVLEERCPIPEQKRGGHYLL